MSIALNILYSPFSGLYEMFKATDYLPTRFPAQYEILTAFRNYKRVTLQGCYNFSDSLPSLAFTTRWNPKHPSHVSTRLFCKSEAYLEPYKSSMMEVFNKNSERLITKKFYFRKKAPSLIFFRIVNMPLLY